jgi:hypothetical protein
VYQCAQGDCCRGKKCLRVLKLGILKIDRNIIEKSEVGGCLLQMWLSRGVYFRTCGIILALDRNSSEEGNVLGSER